MLQEQEPAEQEKMSEEAHRQATERIKAYEEQIVTVLKGRVVGEFSTNYAILIGRLIKLSAAGNDDPLIRFAGMFAAADPSDRLQRGGQTRQRSVDDHRKRTTTRPREAP
ncbi:hypothetical protein DAA53_39010 [Bradyrhizobium sp. WBAH23]|nr:hypothetical protein [Bradyrhizobium sp. WBAH41]QCJ86314.1 hypothetical protein DAA53_39010 [Bradyrhizobium sp. WBAH23]QCK08447.1 hypothetical protein DAB18_39010 [Bradyrhizobium sp. WBAH41]